MDFVSLWAYLTTPGTPILPLFFLLGFWIMYKMFRIIMEQKQDIARKQEEMEKSEIVTLVHKIEELVEQIKLLFTKYESHEDRIDMLERKYQEQSAICREREKSITILQKKIDGCFSLRRDQDNFYTNHSKKTD